MIVFYFILDSTSPYFSLSPVSFLFFLISVHCDNLIYSYYSYLLPFCCLFSAAAAHYLSQYRKLEFLLLTQHQNHLYLLIIIIPFLLHLQSIFVSLLRLYAVRCTYISTALRVTKLLHLLSFFNRLPILFFCFFPSFLHYFAR